jgi:hypothetical protein
LELDAYYGPNYESPEPVFVSKADGDIMAVEDVVEQLSAYFKTHRDGILMVKEGFSGKRPCRFVLDGKVEYDTIATLGECENMSADTKVSFEGFLGIVEPTMESLPVRLWAEGQDPSTLDNHCVDSYSNNTT